MADWTKTYEDLDEEFAEADCTSDCCEKLFEGPPGLIVDIGDKITSRDGSGKRPIRLPKLERKAVTKTRTLVSADEAGTLFALRAQQSDSRKKLTSLKGEFQLIDDLGQIEFPQGIIASGIDARAVVGVAEITLVNGEKRDILVEFNTSNLLNVLTFNLCGTGVCDC